MTRIVESILRNENAIITVSCLLENYLGVSDICLSVPVVLDRRGVRDVIQLQLEDKEIADFRRSAAIVTNVARSLGL